MARRETIIWSLLFSGLVLIAKPDVPRADDNLPQAASVIEVVASTNKMDRGIGVEADAVIHSGGALPPRAARTHLLRLAQSNDTSQRNVSKDHPQDDGHDHGKDQVGADGKGSVKARTEPSHEHDHSSHEHPAKNDSATKSHAADDGHGHGEKSTSSGDHAEGDGHDHGKGNSKAHAKEKDDHDHSSHEHPAKNDSAAKGHAADDGHGHGKKATSSDDHADSDGHDHGKGTGKAHSKEKDGHDHSSHEQPTENGKTAKGHVDGDGHDHDAKKPGSSDGHGAGDGHAHGSEEGHGDSVKLTTAQMNEFGVKTQAVGSGRLAVTITRPAEVSFNLDQYAHVVPRVAGIVRSVNAAQGQIVQKDQVLAVLESRELADAKAAYLAGRERLALAKDTFEREKSLQEKNITSEKAFFAARSDFAEARISVRLAEQKLHALGIDKGRLLEIEKETGSELTVYTMRAPLSGVVVNRHLVLGESVATDREAFLIADVSNVWVDISIYPSDLPKVVAGLHVEIRTETGIIANGKIAHITPNVSEQTRTAKARVVIENTTGKFSPGMFVNAVIDISAEDVALRVPKSALQTHEGKEVVFVSEHGVFEPRPVKRGRQNGQFVEVVDGLKPGELIVAEGAFVIKSQLSKESFGDGHNH